MRIFSYKRLFKKLIDLDMTNNELMEFTWVRRWSDKIILNNCFEKTLFYHLIYHC